MDAEAYADMLPWLIFFVVDRQSGLNVSWAAGSAAASGLALFAWSYWRGRRSPVVNAAIGIFTLCLAIALLLPEWDRMVYAPRVAVVLSLSVLAFVSLRFTPITEVYTAPLVTAEIRADPRFRHVNVHMTMGWGLGALLVAGVCWAGGITHTTITLTLCEWVLPLTLAVGTSLNATRRWELFRLSVEAAPSNASLVPNVAITSKGREHRGDAVIHHLPLRRDRGL